jgi:hypothetical protein
VCARLLFLSRELFVLDVTKISLLFRGLFSRKRGALTGASAVRRLKSYSAQSGFTYQYLYEGHRVPPEGSATEFVFTVSADRKTWYSASVLLSNEALAPWESATARTLTPTERYAVAKIALFQAFDDRATPALMREEVRVRPADVAAIVEILGL